MGAFCPACGSDSIQITKTKHALPIVYGSPAVYDEVLEQCLVCGESGDFSGENDELVEAALEIAKKQSVIDMLDALSHKGIKMSYIERTLELPSRTIARWKGGELSAATLALLRIIRTFPWILEVADSRFDQSVAKYRLVEEASRELHEALKPHTTQAQMTIFSDNEQVEVHTKITFKVPGFATNSLQPRLERMAVVGGIK
jgi:hypothetical protein